MINCWRIREHTARGGCTDVIGRAFSIALRGRMVPGGMQALRLAKLPAALGHVRSITCNKHMFRYYSVAAAIWGRYL